MGGGCVNIPGAVQKYAAVCRNGDVMYSHLDEPLYDEKYCRICGKEIITRCPSCNAPIKGSYEIRDTIPFGRYTPPNYCPNCAAPFPWTQAKIQNAAKIIEEEENFSEEQRDKLVEVLPDVVVETPKTQLAAVRVKKALQSAGQFTVEGLRQFLMDCGCELVKKLIGM